MHFFCIFLHFWHVFAFFLATYSNFVCRSDSVRQTKNPFVTLPQCNKQNISVSQWLCATNNIERNIQFVCGMWQRNWRKKLKTNIPSKLSFTTTIKLLLGNLTIHGFVLNMNGFVLNMTGFVLNMTGFVLNMTGLVLNMTGFVLNMTGFDLNITGFVLNMTIFAHSITKS